MRKHIFFVAILFAIPLLIGPSATGDDTADLFKMEIAPNLIWEIDTSGSMMSLPCAENDRNNRCDDDEFDAIRGDEYPKIGCTYPYMGKTSTVTGEDCVFPTFDEEFPLIFGPYDEDYSGEHPLSYVGPHPDYVYRLGSSDNNWECLGLPYGCEICVRTTGLKKGCIGGAYSETLSAGCGTEPYIWSIVSGGLPPGLSLNPATGEISGTPPSSSCVFCVKTNNLRRGCEDHYYSERLTADCGTPPYTWRIVNGWLPRGLSLNSSTGVISGTPTRRTGRRGSRFTVEVTDSTGARTYRSLSIRIRYSCWNLGSTTTEPCPMGGTGNYNFTVQVADKLGNTADRNLTITINSTCTSLGSTSELAECPSTGYCDSVDSDCYQDLTTKGYHKPSGGWWGGGSSAVFLGNFLNFYPPKFVISRKVLREALRDSGNTRMGMIIFNGRDGGTIIYGINPDCASLFGQPGEEQKYLDNRDRLMDEINELRFNAWTPAGETLDDIGYYYNTYMKSNSSRPKIDDQNPDEIKDLPNDSICHWCQKNFAVILTDGIPTQDTIPNSSLHSGRSYTGDYLLDDVAGWLYNEDLRADAACCSNEEGYCPGDDDDRKTCNKQNVVTYTVALGIPNPADPALCVQVLQDAANNGGGECFSADNAEELADALKRIMSAVKASVSYTSPVIPSGQVKDVREAAGLSSEDMIYLASFEPSVSKPYKGHLRAYYFDCKGHIVGGENCHPEDCDDCELVVTDDSGNVTEVKCGGCELATDAEGKILKDDGTLYNPDAQPIWDAGEKLRDKSADDRKIYTVVGGVRIEFSTDSTKIDSSSLNLLRAALDMDEDLDKDGDVDGDDADLLIEFVRGKDIFDYDGDSDKTDDRPWKLGDIFHSSPVLVGQPNPGAYYFGFTCACKEDPVTGFKVCYPDKTDAGFRDSYEILLRPKMIVVGGNDGMLHCFNAGNASKIDNSKSDNPDTCWREDLIKEWIIEEDIYKKNVEYDEGTGEEMWAFIPPNLLPKLKDMTHSHQFYVDGTPMIADDYLGGETFRDKLKKSWRTVVVCGEREGGKHYFALDITYPEDNDPDDSSYDCPKFLWDFTDPMMGFTLSEAIHGGEYGRIGELNVTEKWVTMMGGGYNPAEGPSTINATGNAFFVVDIANGNKLWEFSYDPGAADDRKYMTYDITSTPTPVDWNFLGWDWFIDWVYIGDLGGQMWRLDLNNQSGKIFFQADTSQSDQPIHFRPSFTIGEWGNLWIYFGTGDRNNPQSLTDSQDRNISNRLYGIMDFDGLKDPDDNLICSYSPPYDEGNLTDITDPGVKPVNDPKESDGLGWYIRLSGQENYDGQNHKGEKAIPKSSVLMGKVYFPTYVPPGAVDDPCLSGGEGEARLYILGYASGAAEGDFEGGGRSEIIGKGIPSPVIVTAKITEEGELELTAWVSTSSGELTKTEIPVSVKPCSILSWREIIHE